MTQIVGPVALFTWGYTNDRGWHASLRSPRFRVDQPIEKEKFNDDVDRTFGMMAVWARQGESYVFGDGAK